MSEQKTEMRANGSPGLGWIASLAFSAGSGERMRSWRLEEPVIYLQRSDDQRATSLVIDDAAISQDAVRLQRVDDGAYELTDNDSKNSVRINGEVARKRILQPNDVVRIGNSVLVIDKGTPKVHPSSRSHLGRVGELAEELAMHQSAAAALFEIDASYLTSECDALMIWSPGARETRIAAKWAARIWDLPLSTVNCAEEDALLRIKEAPANVALLVEGLESAGAARQVELGRALLGRADGLTRTFTIIGLPLEMREADTPIRRTIELLDHQELCIPSLNERKRDILPELIALCARAGDLREILQPDTVEILLCYAWPLELAELVRTGTQLRRIVTHGELMTPAMLPSTIRERVKIANSEGGARVDFDAVLTAAREHDGNMKEVASSFGYSRTYFYRMLRRRNISIDEVRSRLKETS